MKKHTIGLICSLLTITAVSILFGFFAEYNTPTIHPFLSSLSDEHPSAAASIHKNPNFLFEDNAPLLTDEALTAGKTRAIPDAETAAAVAEAICAADPFAKDDDIKYVSKVILYDRTYDEWHIDLVPDYSLLRTLNDPSDRSITLGGYSREITLRASDGKILLFYRFG